MTIFLYNLKRLLKSKGNIFFMIIVPIALIIFSMGLNTKEMHFKIGLIDNDNTKLTEIFKSTLKTQDEVFNVPKGKEKYYLIDKRFDYVMEIPKGFTQNTIKGKYVNIKGYSIKETNESLPIKMRVSSFLNAVRNISNASKDNETKFYEGIKNYLSQNFCAEYKYVGESKSNSTGVISGLGFLVMNMLFLSTNMISIILKDKKSNVYFRIFSTPISVKKYMIQNIASFLVILLVQISLIFYFMVKVFNANFGPSIWNMFILFFIFAIVSVSISVLIASISKSIRQASTVITLISTPMCMLGGCFWPRDIMPSVLQNVSNFVPTTWVLKGAEKLVSGGNLTVIYKEIFILGLFALTFILLSSWRKVDIIR